MTTQDDVERELRRVAERVVSLGPARLARPSEGHEGADPTPQGRVRALAAYLADLAADLEGEPRRAVPELAPHALADQLVVLTRDAVAAALDHGDPAVRDDALDDVHARLVALRRSL
ncbi:hypothetical protein [Thalassiella azotivora]